MTLDVDVTRLAPQPDNAIDAARPARAAAKSVWEYQCVAHNRLGRATREATLEPWLADGWEAVQVVTKGTHEFHYVRRLRPAPDDMAE